MAPGLLAVLLAAAHRPDMGAGFATWRKQRKGLKHMDDSGNEKTATGARSEAGAGTEGEGAEAAAAEAAAVEHGAEGAESAEAGGEPRKPGGDKTVALREERDRRRQAEADLARERERTRTLARLLVEKGRGQKAGTEDGLELDLSESIITAEELDAGDVKSINAKIAKAIGAAAEAAAARAVRTAVAATSGEKQVDRLLSRFAIFSDEDAELRRDAQVAAIRAIEELPDGASEAEFDAALEAVAKRMSRYKANKAGENGDEAGDDSAPVRVGGGTAAAAHLKFDGPKPKNMEEAGAAAQKMLSKIGSRFRRRFSDE